MRAAEAAAARKKNRMFIYSLISEWVNLDK